MYRGPGPENCRKPVALQERIKMSRLSAGVALLETLVLLSLSLRF